MPKVKVTAEYKGHPVITGDYKLFGYNERHLKNNLEMLESAVKRHNRILSYRMDIRFPADSEKIKNKKGTREFIKDFLSSYTNKLARAGLDPDYVLKIEKKTSENAHLHTQFLVDGNKKLDHKDLAEMAEELIEKQLGMEPGDGKGLVHYGMPKKKKRKDQDAEINHQEDEQEKEKRRKKACCMIRRGSPYFQEQFDRSFKDGSYLAKDDPDDVIPSDYRKIYYSRYKRKRCRRKD